MKTLPIMLLILASSLLSTNTALAQNKPLACQTDAVGGLQWENGRWVTTSYLERRFILVETKDGLTTDSVGKALNSDLLSVSCRKAPFVTCYDNLGGNLYFNPQTLNGGISQLLGSISSNATRRDSVSVQVFSCTPF